MKNRLFRVAIFAIASLLIISCSATKDRRGIRITENDYTITISGLNEKTISVRVYPKDDLKRRLSMVVDDSLFNEVNYQSGDRLETSKLIVEYEPLTQVIHFIDRTTKDTILSESSRSFVPFEVMGDKGYSISQTFKLREDESIYGLGQFQEGVLNYRGKEAYLVHANREIANPVLLSSNNYLLFWDNYSKTCFKDNEEKATFWSEMGDGIDYYFVYGDDMKDAVAEFRKLTGEVPMLPKSAYGFWVSRERYRSFDELVDVVAEYRRRKIPIDNIVQDWQYWGGTENHEMWNRMEFSSDRFANPKAIIDKLHDEYKVKLTLSVWPCAGTATELYQELEQVDALFDISTWAGYKVIDIYNPEAQKIYWNRLYNGLYSKGVDSWWMDATEPSFRDGLYQEKQEEWSKKAGMTHIGPFHRYLNTYSLVLSKLMYENLRKQNNKRVSILTRSAFAGQQRYGTSTWSGDIYASWGVLQKQIVGGLNLSMTGIPYWTSDIGGFRVKSSEHVQKGATGELSSYLGDKVSTDGGYTKGLEDPAYLELYTRWFQFGAFNPMFRIHGTEIPREIWYFGEPGTPFYDAQVEMINLRYSLLSYIYSTAWQVTSQGATMMRALVMDFTSDERVHNDSVSYMFGDALLVHPITYPMYYDREGKITELHTEVDVYLPKHRGMYWYDLNSNGVFEGGKVIRYDAPLNRLPLFAKGGSIVPRNKPVQHVGADDNATMELLIYTGADATFTLYEDDNETYAYEEGEYTTIEMNWNENGRTLSFSAPRGKSKPHLKERTFKVKVLTPSGGKVVVDEKDIVYQNRNYQIQF